MVRLTIAAIISFILISLIFAGISSAQAGLSPQMTIKIDPKNIVGIWLFDEGKGDIAKDSSSNKITKQPVPFSPQANSPTHGETSSKNRLYHQGRDVKSHVH